MLTGLGVLALLALVWGVYQLRVYPAVGAGYRAKALCTALFGSRRTFDVHLRAQISDDAYAILRPFRVRVDSDAQTVTASLFGLMPRTAVHRDGLGATLLAGAPPVQLPRSAAPRQFPTRREWRSAATPPELRRAVDAAFAEPDPRRLRRTYAVVVVHDGQIVAERYACGITAETPMPGWSMAKSVLNALVGVLVAEGSLTLDQRELLPAWRPPDPRAAITIEDLLCMRSGLRFSEAYGNPWSHVLRMLYMNHDAAGYAAGLPLEAAPGTVWQYASGTTNILSAIVRRTVGDADYHAWPGRVLFEPLGMQSAVLEPDGSGTFICSSYMVATARDWARFGQLFMDGGRGDGRAIVPAEWVRFSTTPTPQCPGARFGAHWWLKLNPEIGGDSPAAQRIPSDAFFAVGHEGQTLSIIPSRRLVVVRLGASIHIDAWNQAELLTALLDAL